MLFCWFFGDHLFAAFIQPQRHFFHSGVWMRSHLTYFIIQLLYASCLRKEERIRFLIIIILTSNLELFILLLFRYVLVNSDFHMKIQRNE